MLITDVIRKKRDRGELSAEEIEFFVAGVTDGSIADEQVAALAMAVFLNSMTFEEASRLTRAMAASGTMLDWRADELGGPVVDKHSTGGIGDKVSILLAPIAAACGCYVPMISGRGLGHGGGTLDKIEAIPGYNAVPSLEQFRKVVASIGCAIIGQTRELAPADRRLYAIRDVTATVESKPLIIASILSKKMAAGLGALVMDIKVGSGAFMATMDEARSLARGIIGTARHSGVDTHALITDMNENLGTSCGNALEVCEAVRYLTGEVLEPRLHEVVLMLAVEMLLLGGLDSDRTAARKRAEGALSSGRAAEVFGRMVSALGGPSDFVERYESHLPRAAVRKPVAPAESGYLQAVDGHAFGHAVISLGGGRRRRDDELDLSVGFSEVAPIGSEVGADAPLATVHAASTEAAELAAGMLRGACTIGPEPPPPRPVVYETLTAADSPG